MKHLSSFKCGAVLCGLILSAASAFSQGTAFTYQGRLANGGSPVTGLYDFTNALYNASSGGVQAGSTITLTAVPVTNGLFTVLLDFDGVFNGTPYWLQMGVRSNGVGSYVALSPRQQLTPTPYAITAENLDGTLLGSQLTGTLPSGLLSGLYGNAVNLNNAANSFTGNGGGLTGLNASQLTSGTVPDVRLSGNVALLNRTQTFTGANIFDRGVSGPGRLIVNGSSSVDTNAFTGLGFQYYTGLGEGAIMSSYNDGYGFLSFYTKSASGQPITKQMIISRYGDVAIDQADANDGFLNNTTLGGAGLSFGIGSGEGIASKRTVGGNQFGLDFYTGFTRHMSLSQSGNLLFPDPTTSIVFPATAGVNNPMIFMFDSGTGNANRMVIAHSPAFPSYGLQYEDVSDKFHFLSAGTDVMTVDLGTRRVGIGTTIPSAKLEVAGTAGTDGIKFPDGSLQLTAPKPVFASGYGQDPWNTNRFLAPTVIVTVISSSQQILVTSHKALGSIPGAASMNLYIGYRASGSGAAPLTVGGGIFGNKVAANTRVIMGMSGVISGLTPGNYEVGLVGSSTDYLNWNSNEWGYTTATVY